MKAPEKKIWQWTLYYCGSLAALSSLKKQIHCDSASVFFLALCLWKNRPQQKPIFAFREMSCLISLYQSIYGIQWGSSSVDILSLGFRWYLAFKNPIETLTDLKKKHTQIKIHEHFSGQLQLTKKKVPEIICLVCHCNQKIANKILSILRKDKTKSHCFTTVSNIALMQLHPKYHMQ